MAKRPSVGLIEKALRGMEVPEVYQPRQIKRPDPPPDDLPVPGRPTVYRDGFAEQARRLHLLGLDDAQVAAFFGITADAMYDWDKAHPAFLQARARGKLVADGLVAEKLYERAIGYSHSAVKIFMPAGAEKPVYADYTEHHPPDTMAATWWLKNRHGDRWKDKSETSVSGEIAMVTPEQRRQRIEDLMRRLGPVIEGTVVSSQP